MREVSPLEMVEYGDGDGPVIAALDTGIKRSIVRNFTERYEVYPSSAAASARSAASSIGCRSASAG